VQGHARKYPLPNGDNGGKTLISLAHLALIGQDKSMSRSLVLVSVLIAIPAVGGDEFAPNATERKILELTNLERKNKELPALKPSPLLFKIAQAHSENMAKQGKMEHDLDGKTPGQRLREAGYRYKAAYENIAAGDPQVSIETLMKAWMESKGHRDNI
jgi:hypothetical protein